MLCSSKAPFPRISGVGPFTLHNDHYPQFSYIRGVEAYFLAVCEIRAVYNKTGSEKPVISAFLFLIILKAFKISQSSCVPIKSSQLTTFQGPLMQHNRNLTYLINFALYHISLSHIMRLFFALIIT